MIFRDHPERIGDAFVQELQRFALIGCLAQCVHAMVTPADHAVNGADFS
jgi:hypothetical protein